MGIQHIPLDIQWISAVGLGCRDDIQHPQFADLDVVTTSKSYDMPQPSIDLLHSRSVSVAYLSRSVHEGRSAFEMLASSQIFTIISGWLWGERPGGAAGDGGGRLTKMNSTLPQVNCGSYALLLLMQRYTSIGSSMPAGCVKDRARHRRDSEALYYSLGSLNIIYIDVIRADIFVFLGSV